MFEKGDRIHLHDGRVVTVRRKGVPKKLPRGKTEHSAIRGFVRAALVDCVTGEEAVGDWHENVVTNVGHNMIVRNFVGIQSTHSSTLATGTAQMGWARYWAIGFQGANASTSAAADLATVTAILSEYGTNSASTHNTGSRAHVINFGGQMALSGTWSLTQTLAYASSNMTHGASVNMLAQQYLETVASGSNLSMAYFASSTKGTTQALVDDIGCLTDALLTAA